MRRVTSFDRLLAERFVLGEGSMYERLRREPAVRFDPEVAHATLVYDDAAREVLERTHREYLDIGQAHGVPMLTAADTWRANRERQDRSAFRAHPVNADNVRFLRDLRASYGAGAAPILIGGALGPRGDAYRAEESLDRAAAAAFHAPQIAALAGAGPDYLIANTLPAVSEAHGIADACAATGLSYVLSFVIRADGTVLDGTPLRSAIEAIDAATTTAPAGYGVNCVHPTVLGRALAVAGTDAARRVVYYQANASALSPEELVRLTDLDAERPDALAAAIDDVRTRFGIRAIGGCCGTGTEHIEAMARLGAVRPTA
jgi:homocysteine S-methyltransferase